MTLHRMYFYDNKGFGCGWRLVAIETEGRKWAHIFDPYTLKKARIPVRELRHAMPVQARKRRIYQAMLDYHRAMNQTPNRTRARKIKELLG